MCGIVGLINKKNSTSIASNLISDMCDIISHRGPDDHGIFVDNNIGLGHTRLSIIDLTTGRQPMLSRDQRFVIVFNGEIYNYQELKNNLQDQGASFVTNSDTEVILELYRRHSKDCVNFLNGIFAFCIYDKQTKDIFLARDHLGVKPLYYYNDDNHFVFSSEIKAILKSNLVQAKCNTNKVSEYFIFRQIAGPETLFKNIYTLPPGSFLSITGGDISITQYWDITTQKINEHISFHEAYDKLSNILLDAIKLQMVSDVPLGTFCSGGVDSSLVTAIAAMNTSEKINTFSVGFDDKEYDESKYARIVSEKYQTCHHELKLNNCEFANIFEKSIWHNDLPLNFANSLLIYALSSLAKQSVTVVLTGEGADELFGGYPRYMIPSIHAKLSHTPDALIKIAKYGLNLIPGHKSKKLASFLDMDLKSSFLYNSAILSQNEMDLYSLRKNTDYFNYRNFVIDEMDSNNSALNKVSLLDQQTYLISILNRQDKMSMAAGIESRVPILDYRLVEFANTLPETVKCKKLNPKLLLKKLAEKYLPHEVIYRQKSGFGVPLHTWFASNEGLGKIADEILTESCLEELEWNGNIRKIITEHKSNISNHSEFLWSAINYVQWKSTFNVSV